ncbi:MULTISPECIES: nucleoside recognition domain-containing protein [Halomonadaceae]|jgi:spore maturation protein SpmA|uniref:Nucleoside transporter/FeoB GTPase Gate domain-containing protein n=2 Tax=Halomonadaceae TaxID=28256 RepID=A0A6F8U7T6_9GAMM|nr:MULTISPECIES: spore maturation protein [Halomonas]MBR9925877.1 spore maturation protein [Gammaproteobacteria bacterium]MDW0359630.1 nucleoside recognition domain-containing protein [Halomonas venusta]MDX1356513.1 nucleoside recognition domain-containing protein [Halomonas venusta]MDX1712145.1 nucleoside recognition domain-containing protein [Halomonas venusta]QPI63338.1 spore maturation protein [Halomonas venusta]
MLNGIWLSFFIAAFAASLWQWLVGGDSEIFARLVQSLFDMASVSVDIILVLLGTMTLWLGFLSIAEKAGMIRLLGRVLDPLFSRLMPEVPRGHPAMGLISMNFAANILGLDNAATPIGIKAMQSLQSLNPSRDTASNAQILFLVLNTSSLTLLPVTIFIYRAQQGAAEPTLVFLPILLATSASSLAGLLAVALVQRLKLWQPVVLAYLVAAALALGLLITTLAGMSAQALAAASTLVGNLTLFTIVMMFLVVGALRGVRVYDAFIEGAKEGVSFTVTLLPYLIAMLVAVGVLRASGVLDAGLSGIRWLVEGIGWDTRFVDALPTAFVKPLSGSGSRAMMIETMNNFGVDSFPGLLAATLQGSTETTFYVLAVYFGAVGVTRIRHGLGCALIADAAGIITAITVCYWFFG